MYSNRKPSKCMFVEKFLKSIILVCIPLFGSCQAKETRADEKVVEYNKTPIRNFEATVQQEYLENDYSLILYEKRNRVLAECAQLTSTDRYKELTLSIKRDDCSSHNSACEHIQNFMNLVIEWILENQATLSEQQAIHEVLYVKNMKKVIELDLNNHLLKYHNSAGLISYSKHRKTESFFLEIIEEKITLSEKFKTATLPEIKEFCFTIKDWALVNETIALNKILRY